MVFDTFSRLKRQTKASQIISELSIAISLKQKSGTEKLCKKFVQFPLPTSNGSHLAYDHSLTQNLRSAFQSVPSLKAAPIESLASGNNYLRKQRKK
jgi:hypothetical protein